MVGITQAELARLAGLSTTGLNNIERGDTPCRLASSGTVASSRSASSAIFALNAASNFLRDFVISRSIGCDRAGRFTP
jgi:DNA-binding XRE family transcriptional regulator